MELSKKISEAVNRRYEKELVMRDFIKVDKIYWHPTHSDFTGDNIKVYEIKTKCYDFFSVKNLLLILVDEGIKIYRISEKMHLKNIKSIKEHLLIFLVRKEALRQNVKNFFYKILLYLVWDETIRVESHLEGIMLYLNVDEIENIKEYKSCVEIEYKNGEKKLFDNKLKIREGVSKEEIEKGVSKEEIEKGVSKDEIEKGILRRRLVPNTLVKLMNKNIYIFRESIRIEFTSGISKKEIETKKITKAVESERYLFLKNEESIKAIIFDA
ncbi:hypothetical protein NGRA_0570 [Nosema granulosis]|uniref:Uncharacterized protein n=1 Tax=Nosema granulosis TaxID=83296 RepID=A0A9P6H0L9_9MICR|nr:hypothetical protein NGRA_0570 [Nosema granulosis]